MDASSRILSELATREQALDRQIETARVEATREVEAAEAEAARILRQAEEQARAETAQAEAALAEETARIREEARAVARRESDAATQRGEGKLAQAVETILRAVLP